VSDSIKDYMDKADRFSKEELYQGVPGGTVQASRDLAQRWDAYAIRPRDLAGKAVLDVGCNIGGFSAICSPHCREYLGIDVFAPSIEMARSLFPFQNCSFRVQSFNDMDEQRWDVILALAVRRYTLLTCEQFAKHAHGILMPGGKMYFESHTREQLGARQRKAFERWFNIARVVTVPGSSHPDCKHTRFFIELGKK